MPAKSSSPHVSRTKPPPKVVGGVQYYTDDLHLKWPQLAILKSFRSAQCPSAVHSYAQTAAYHELLKMQAKAGALVLPKHRIRWEVLDWRLAQPVAHIDSPGAQLADLVTSAFYQAADTLPPTKWNSEFARLLEPIMAKENGSCMDYGVALQ